MRKILGGLLIFSYCLVSSGGGSVVQEKSSSQGEYLGAFVRSEIPGYEIWEVVPGPRKLQVEGISGVLIRDSEYSFVKEGRNACKAVVNFRTDIALGPVVREIPKKSVLKVGGVVFLYADCVTKIRKLPAVSGPFPEA